nr:His/Gly/Thr/Pro-type tRNA ligase C-terminal domain-containing protein [Saprospiraceae bacterium]
FVAVLIEHTAGKFPLWLTPEQFAILPISDQYNDAAKQILTDLNASGLRGVIDDRSESIGRKIRDTELKKIPFMLILGEKEMASNTVSVRKQGEGDLGGMAVKDFIQFIKEQL